MAIAVGACVLLAIAAVAWMPELGDVLPRSDEERAVVAAVERFVIANQTVGIPEERDPDGKVAPETVAAMHAEVRSVADELFAPSYREQWALRMDEYIDGEMAAEFIFGGGADGFMAWRITINGDRASVEVRCRIHLDMAQTFTGRRTRAENTVDYEVTLERHDGRWLIAGQSHRFAPGGGP